MPTLSEQIAASTSKLDALLAAPAPEAAPAESEQTMTPAEAMLQIATELAKGATPERTEYLKGIAGEIAKNFESKGEGAISIKVINDPMQIKPGTAPIAPIQSLSTGTPVNNFASDMAGLQKAEKIAVIVKMLTNADELKSVIAKSALTDKMDQIKSMFSLSEADMKDTYDVRWKIGELIGVLQNAIKLEQLVGGGSKTEKEAPVEPAATAPAPTEKSSTVPAVWPRDMAGAKFDPVKKAYEPEPNVWSE